MDFSVLKGGGDGGENGTSNVVHGLVGSTVEIGVQIVISVLLGIPAFLTFCILRPRWPGLYAARKKQRGEAAALPELPTSFLGWIPALWKVTEQQVLAAAGLDAFVFLRFFRMALKFLVFTLFCALVVIKPVHDAFPEKSDKGGKNKSHPQSTWSPSEPMPITLDYNEDVHILKANKWPTDFLWMYLVFAYVFTGLALYLLTSETRYIIRVRQEYLGNQASVTDKTIRLSGVPLHLRSEEKLKEYIEGLEIGKVDRVTICRDWSTLDAAMNERMSILRKLEESWTIYLSKRGVDRSPESLPVSHPSPPVTRQTTSEEDDEAGESGPLLENGQNGSTDADPFLKSRPRITVRYGFLKLQSYMIDAIDYYEEKLRKIDEQITTLREEEKNMKPTPLAFVTMESVATCQMAIQAVLDPAPMTLIAKQSPTPENIVWSNTYMPWPRRLMRRWTVTIAIGVLTIFFAFILVPIAGIKNLKTIAKVWPELAKFLEKHELAESLVSAQLPTLLSTLLFVAIPYLYDWLANEQGMMSQGEVELSVVSKNFFFVFFNYFVIFTLLGTFSNFYEYLEHFRDALKDATQIANTLATSLVDMQNFYCNLIILQGVGLFPFRLLEFGSVALYPIYRIGSKTPRDFAELVEPPVFNYGFYLPQVMLIFIICIVYSILRESWKVLLAGVVYFTLGLGVYKYQLLYAMDHRQELTGRAWVMISYRMIVGILLFQLSTAGQLALKSAFVRAALVVPLILVTIWFSRYYSQNFEPLMKYLSLSTIERKQQMSAEGRYYDPDGWGTAQESQESQHQSGDQTPDEARELERNFVNPSIVAPLQQVWISDNALRQEELDSQTSHPIHTPSPRRRLTSALNAMF